MRKTALFLALGLAGLGTAQPAPILLARGELSGLLTDLSTATTGALGNGVAGNLLGGIGSGIAWAGGTTFLALPDRGPNATPYNAAVDDTASYIPRFQTLNLSLNASAPGAPLPYTLTPTLVATTLLSSAMPLNYGSGAGLGNRIDGATPIGSGAPALNATDHTYYFSGRSDNFDAAQPSSNAINARLDPEGIRVSNDGKSVFVSDEYGPYVYQFDRATGQRIRTFSLPAHFAVAAQSPQKNVEIAGNASGRVTNKGMEGLAITPDGKTLVGIMQAPLAQDGGDGASTVRIVTIDIASGATHEYAYALTNTGTAGKPKYNGISEIVALNDHEFLIDERDGKGLGDGSSAAFKTLYRVNLSGAQDVSGLSGESALAAKAVAKSVFLDLTAALNLAGIANSLIPAKIEGLALGADTLLNGVAMHTLYVASDNDFLDSIGGLANPNQFFVFGFVATAGDGIVAQQFIPEPAGLALFGLGLAGLVARRRRA